MADNTPEELTSPENPDEFVAKYNELMEKLQNSVNAVKLFIWKSVDIRFSSGIGGTK